MKIKYAVLVFLAMCMGEKTDAQANKSSKIIKTLIVDGQNNHDQWAKITYMMKQYLEETGKFSVDVKRSHFTWNGKDFIEKYPIIGTENTEELSKSQADPNFHPDFSKYDVVICNFGWNAAPWSAETQADFEKFIQKGGGLVVVHAADNSFPQWLAYNKMIGLGGWGDRTEKDGPYVYYDQQDKLVRDNKPGKAGSHGPQLEFQITIRNAKHPITKGMPLKWMHSKDEMYNSLRGPAENMEILGTAFSAKADKGSDRHEPMLMTLNYGKGRIFHTPLGHVDYSVECVGFITCLLRGTQWAATGKVDIPIPADFPTEKAVSARPFLAKNRFGDVVESMPGVVSYTYRNDFAKDVPKTLDNIKATGVTNIEFSNLFGKTSKELRALLNARGMRCTSYGTSYDNLLNKMDTVIQDAKNLGAEFVRVAWIPHTAPMDIDLAKKTVADFNIFGKKLKDAGLTFCYHNHGFEFLPYNDGTYFDYIVQNTDPKNVSFEMDILWVFHPGQDPAALLNKYPNRFRLMHVKDLRKGVKHDFTGGTPPENDVTLGTGQLNLPEILKAARKTNIKYFYIEDESPTANQQVPVSLAYLKGLK